MAEELKLKQETRKSSRDILVRPVITEKSIQDATLSNKYTFEVTLGSNKIEIRQAVEDIFKVKVINVTTTTVKGKRRVRFDKRGRHVGYSKDWKKARVALKEGDKIEIAGFNPFEM